MTVNAHLLSRWVLVSCSPSRKFTQNALLKPQGHTKMAEKEVVDLIFGFAIPMDGNRKTKNIIDTVGEEIIRIVTPVSICMFLLVILVCILNNDSTSSSGSSIAIIATIVYTENTSDSAWDKFKGALLNSLLFVAVVTVVTFLLVLLFYFRCTKFLKYYMGFSVFLVLGFMGGEIALLLVEYFSFPIDCITFLLVLFNFTVAGVLAVFMPKMAIFVTQGSLIVIGMLVAYWFTLLPEWTTWVLLVAMALYDLAAVLLPGGPLRLLVELAMSRDEDIPALVYEARPINYDLGPVDGVVQRRLWRERPGLGSNSNATLNPVSNSTPGTFLSTGSGQNDRNLINIEENRISGDSGESQLTAPLIEHGINVRINLGQDGETAENLAPEGVGLGSSGAIKLGLGDFIFYSILVGRASMYDFMTVYACYLSIIAGLGITLVLLAFYHKALPALPVSVALGVLFYMLTRLLLEEFIVQCSVNLLMF